jgi:hypothetical protein
LFDHGPALDFGLVRLLFAGFLFVRWPADLMALVLAILSDDRQVSR